MAHTDLYEETHKLKIAKMVADIDATTAELFSPHGIVISPANGDVFITDKFNHRVRQLSASSGKIKTICGDGVYGYDTSTVASMAMLTYPSGIVMNGSDVLYVSDTTNRIRKIVLSTDTISTYAGANIGGNSGDGGLATLAKLDNPSGLAISPLNGDLYIVSNDRIRVVSSVDNTISTIAGGGLDTSLVVENAINAKLNSPSSVVVSNNGEVYIGESDKIRKILTNGTSISMFNTSSFPGATYASSSACNGLAISPSGDLLYATVSDRVYMIFLSNGSVTLLAGSTSGYGGDNQIAQNAKFSSPTGIVVSPKGELLISDIGNNRIRKINTNNTIVTIAGIGPNVAYNGDGIDAVKAKLVYPESVIIGKNNEIIVADTGNRRLRMISNGTISTIFSDTMDYGITSPITSSTAGIYYYATFRHIVRYSTGITYLVGTSSPGYNGDDIVATSASVNVPKGIVFDLNGDLIIADTQNNRIRKVFSINNTITTIAGNGISGYNGDGLSATSSQINNPYGIVLTSNGEVIFSEYQGHRVRKILNNGTLITIAGNGENGYSGENLDGVNSMLKFPAGLAILSNDELLICDSYNHVIRKLFKNGTLTTIVGIATVSGYNGDNNAPLNTKLYQPLGVALSPDGSKIYIADSSNGKIRMISYGCDMLNNCNGNGDCLMNNCSCYSGWRGGSTNCSSFSCDGVNNCSGHGNCVSNNTCSCNAGWRGSIDCSLFSCDKLNNCSGNGICISSNNCSCFDGYNGLSCEKIVSSNNSCVVLNNCSGHGTCMTNLSCSCDAGWMGNLNCSLPSCEKLNNCSGNGICASSNVCNCLDGYSGLSCENRIVPTIFVSVVASKSTTKKDNSNVGLIVGVVVGSLVLIMLIVIVVIVSICLVVKFNKRNVKKTPNEKVPIEMINSVDENITAQTGNTSLIASEYLISDFPTETNSYYNIPNTNDSTNYSSMQQSRLNNMEILKYRYKIQKVIGQGAFGKCYLCLDSKKNDMPVAIKTIHYDQSRHSKIIDECSKTLSYRHPNLVEVYEFFESESIQSICIVMKFYKGDLEHAFKELKQNGKIISEKMIISIMKQVGDGLNYLHTEKLIVHRDIKPRNIFYSSLDCEKDEIQVVIGDYGEAKETGETQNSIAGTLQYMAPEVFSRKYSYGADIFSLGVSLIQAMASDSLDLNMTAQLLYEKEDVVLGKIMEHLISRGYSEKICNFIVKMVSKEPSVRPTSYDIQHFE